MFSFGRSDVRQFGGVGVMIDSPGLCLTISLANTITASGPMAEQAIDRARSILAAMGNDAPATGCHIQIERAPPPHVGLGSGTQLALSIAAGLDAIAGRELREPEALAKISGRARRSSIGTHGFFRGGLLVDPGKLAGEEVPPLLTAVPLPSAWRFVLLRPARAVGLSGDAERAAFGNLPPVSESRTAELYDIALSRLVPAAQSANFEAFSEALEEFGRLAGECFASQQGGKYASVDAMRMIELARSLGVNGVAQSSWGPTVAALLSNTEEAKQLVARVRQHDARGNVETTIAAPSIGGAVIERVTH
jgi:beta-RFAP synthase